MSLGLRAPENPAQFWDIDNAAGAGVALADASQTAGGGMLEKFGSFFSGAASGALSGLASATPYGAIANVVGAAVKDAPLQQTAEGGRISNRMSGDRIINVGKGATQTASKATPSGTISPWLIGGLILAGLMALKITKG